MSGGTEILIVPEFNIVLRLVHVPDTSCKAYDSVLSTFRLLPLPIKGVKSRRMFIDSGEQGLLLILGYSLCQWCLLEIDKVYRLVGH
jgi:hypothetical protein